MIWPIGLQQPAAGEAERSPSAKAGCRVPDGLMPLEQRRRRGSGRNSSQALGHAQTGPHWHCTPQAQAFCAADCWQPQVQLGPGQVAQRQGFWFVSFMMGFLWVYRRRDVFDGWTIGAAALPRQSFETGSFRGCRNGPACRPNGCGAPHAGSIDRGTAHPPPTAFDQPMPRRRRRSTPAVESAAGQSVRYIDRSIAAANPCRTNLDG
jgi:hypothetical protein